VLDRGRIIQHGNRSQLAAEHGPFRDLLDLAGEVLPAERGGALIRRERRREREQPTHPVPSLPRTVLALLRAHPRWGLLGSLGFLCTMSLNANGVLTGWWWGQLVAGLASGQAPWWEAALLTAGLLLSPIAVAAAFAIYPLWWTAATLRLRLAVLCGQTMQRRLHRTPPGEVAARALDSERLVLYADRWVDVWIGCVTVLAAGALGRSVLAVAIIGGVLVLSAITSAAGAPLAGRAAREAGDERARFGRSLASTLDAARTVKLAAATGAVQAHLEQVDARRVAASVREHRVRTLLTGVPGVLVMAGVVAAWTAHLTGVWDLATTLLVATTVAGFGWFGVVAGTVVTEVPVARRWLRAAGELAGSRDLTSLPAGVDLVRGLAPAPPISGRVPLQRLSLEGVAAVHDDGTIGVEGVDLTVPRGALVLLAGRVGSGKSSLLSSLAGLVDHEGTIRWNGQDVDDPQLFLRPGQVAFVGQVPRVLSGSFADNVTLDHDREVQGALEAARLHGDVADAGGHAALVGHRGVRLSGGQVQRLALARALATGAELLVADDVSSALDARTEVELWDALRRRGVTVVGASSKRSALERADCVVVLEAGRVVDTGPWARLAPRWAHLAG
jgi:ABC-type multidrug transport system fused ATPase/permease subunit